MNTIYRVMVATGLLAISGFCLYGFLASFESPDFWIWRIGYGAVGSLCVLAAIAAALRGNRLNSS